MGRGGLKGPGEAERQSSSGQGTYSCPVPVRFEEGEVGMGRDKMGPFLGLLPHPTPSHH